MRPIRVGSACMSLSSPKQPNLRSGQTSSFSIRQRGQLNSLYGSLRARKSEDRRLRVDILIGSGETLFVLSIGQVHLSRDQYDVYLQKTLLGWVIVGETNPDREAKATCSIVKLDTQWTRFWELEEIGSKLAYSSEEKACGEHYVRNVKRTSSGRYMVRLPFKEVDPQLGNSRSKAFRQLQAMRHRSKANPNLQLEYTKVMQEYIDLGHMTLTEDKDAGGYCMPHHAVVKPSSITTKTRVVFNASSKTDKNLSLNDVLMVGPTIQPKLFNLLLRFRAHTYVITADIEKMYRQILVDPRDRSYQRILWVHQGRIETYELNTVTFRVSSAPFLAIRTIHQLAEDERASFPRASVILKRDFYVDDLLTGANSLKENLQIRDELI
ncbi:uncharacterized protein LOC111643653 [Copidosoma floridanum]|uniref:uncharacterized protein LOC111643653 n=1 Tax=Copidosoma floridanum TaxID=29053 RepID=UPI000C6F86F8|nr:uncharacterized protein LOC111643653 [Copidosoma floridanum]